MSTPPPAGWYNDPAGSDGKRWWDGERWTDKVDTPVARPAAPTTVRVTKPRRRLRIAVAGAGAVAVVAAGTWALSSALRDAPSEPAAPTAATASPAAPSATPAPTKTQESAAQKPVKARTSTPEADAYAIEKIRARVPLMEFLNEQELKDMADLACDWIEQVPSRAAGDLAQKYIDLGRTEEEAIALTGLNFAWRCPENLDR